MEKEMKTKVEKINDIAKVTGRMCDGQRDDEKHIGIYRYGTTQGISGGV
jgi:hypothetical protein|tara:strand:- start:3237 stop:3383 length:147 start_codon:yes stop_codon:yes gene_type:complete